MPQRSTSQGPPSKYVNGNWPTGRLVAGAPTEAWYAREIARALQAAVKDRNIPDVATAAQLNKTTLYALLNGSTWPDVVSLAKLERTLGVRLWPDTDPEG